MHEPFIQFALQALEQGKPLALASIIAQSGSAPRGSGARMLVFADGSLWGSIGGGAYEAAAIQAAGLIHKAFANGQEPQATVLRFSLEGVTDMDMICGGHLDVLVEPLPLHSKALFAQSALLEGAGKDFLHITCLPFDSASMGHGASGRVQRQLVSAHTAAHSSPGADLPQWVLVQSLEALEARQSPFLLPYEAKTWFIEPFTIPSTVYFFGAGHVSLATAALAATVGFKLAVIDDRPEFVTQQRFPDAQRHILPNLHETTLCSFLSHAGVRGNDALVIVTRGHAHDREALLAGLGSKAGYVGMIGSRSKREQVFAFLRSRGFSEAAIAAVRSPIGLPIYAQSPEEIAVSIVAQLIQWRAEHHGATKTR